MAAPGCVFHRTLSRTRPGPNQVSSCSPAVCRQLVSVVEVQRYSRDQGSSVYFPQAVHNGEDLYDVTLTDGDCRLRVTLDPGLNRLVERGVLLSGATLRNATFMLPACRGASDRDSYRLLSAEVKGHAPGDDDDDDYDEDGLRRSDVDWDSLPWFGSSETAGSLAPLRANRMLFLPLWNNVDYSGAAWTETPPPEEEDDDEEEEEVRRPAVTVSELRDSFLSGRGGVARGTVQHQLIVRIINKSHLMYYGRTDRNCECPYKAVLEVCDRTGSVCVVLWNSACVDWYRRLKPGDVISLRRYRVKQHYQAERDDIEISVNSRNPAARISVLPESSVEPEHITAAPNYSFYNSQQLIDRPHGFLCDVIGLLTFSGRPERIRSKDGRGAELLEYRWLRLEDGSSDQPIMVKLFATSQPEAHRKLHPLSVVVCTRLRLIRASDQTNGCFYLTNTTYTQVYCTGLGHHSEMSYRTLRPVRLFLHWLRSQDDDDVLSRALIGGSFVYPPPPVSLETYMKERRGEPGFLRGAEFQREVERLCYRERRTFCIQATVTMVTYSRRGEEDRCLLWTDRPSSLSPSSSSPRLSKSSTSPHLSSPSPSSSSSSFLPLLSSSPRSPRLPLSSSPRSPRLPLSSSSPRSPPLPLSSSSPRSPRLPLSSSPLSPPLPLSSSSPLSPRLPLSSSSPRSPRLPLSSSPRSPRLPLSSSPRSPRLPLSSSPRSPRLPLSSPPRSPRLPLSSSSPRSPRLPLSSSSPRSPRLPLSSPPRSPRLPLSSSSPRSPRLPLSSSSPLSPRLPLSSSPPRSPPLPLSSPPPLPLSSPPRLPLSSSPRLPLSSPPLSPPLPLSSSSPLSPPLPLSSSSSFFTASPSSAVGQLTPRLHRKAGRLCKRKQLLQAETPKKSPRVTLQPEHSDNTVILFEASMEFLENTNTDEDDDDDDDDDDDEDAASFVTAPLCPAFPPIAMETLQMHYDYDRREEQADAVAMGGRATATAGRFESENYYTLRLRALSDGVLLDATFLPQSSSSSLSPPHLSHSNTWTSILSHGAFSSHTPPPSPGDLISMAAQLTNQRLVCILEACHLGGATTEIVLSRAFLLTD